MSSAMASPPGFSFDLVDTLPYSQEATGVSIPEAILYVVTRGVCSTGAEISQNLALMTTRLSASAKWAFLARRGSDCMSPRQMFGALKAQVDSDRTPERDQLETERTSFDFQRWVSWQTKLQSLIITLNSREFSQACLVSEVTAWDGFRILARAKRARTDHTIEPTTRSTARISKSIYLLWPSGAFVWDDEETTSIQARTRSVLNRLRRACFDDTIDLELIKHQTRMRANIVDLDETGDIHEKLRTCSTLKLYRQLFKLRAWVSEIKRMAKEWDVDLRPEISELKHVAAGLKTAAMLVSYLETRLLALTRLIRLQYIHMIRRRDEGGRLGTSEPVLC
ncbi:hypothetical protein QBC35DRAFT_469367 [Podospora australis]|uniref:Uncharacterized protein n=1 Tax=Podospora australis TaxID=1536484 RepID=A0AAN7ALE6_9PEZI|nr:hypothetical protein QBC35DRAFT_469367 [Podospora australis]